MAAFSVGVLAAPAAGQRPDGGGGLCLRGTRRCEAILLTNLGVHAVANAATPGSAARAVADWGVLLKVGDRTDVGATWLLSVDRDGVLTGPMVRLRQWLTDSASLELSVGTSLLHRQFDTYARTLGLLKWNLTPTVGLALRPELRTTTDYSCLPSPPYGCTPTGRDAFSVSAGLEFSGAPGLILSGIGAATIGVLAAIYSSVSD